MAKKGVSKIDTQVNRPPAAKMWTAVYRWGPTTGDETALSVNRVDGGNLFITYGSAAITIPTGLLDAFAEMVAEAHAWKDVALPDDQDDAYGVDEDRQGFLDGDEVP